MLTTKQTGRGRPLLQLDRPHRQLPSQEQTYPKFFPDAQPLVELQISARDRYDEKNPLTKKKEKKREREKGEWRDGGRGAEGAGTTLSFGRPSMDTDVRLSICLLAPRRTSKLAALMATPHRPWTNFIRRHPSSASLGLESCGAGSEMFRESEARSYAQQKCCRLSGKHQNIKIKKPYCQIPTWIQSMF